MDWIDAMSFSRIACLPIKTRGCPDNALYYLVLYYLDIPEFW